MIGPLTAARRLTSTATGLVTWPVRTGVSVASTAVHGALHLVKPGGEAVKEAAAKAKATASGGGSTPQPVRVPTPPDPAVKLVTEQAEAPAKKAPAKKAPAKKAPAKKAPSKKAAFEEPAKAAAKKATPKPPAKAPAAKKKASDVPLKSDPTPASAAPPLPEGPDVLPGEEGATGLAEGQPLLDEGAIKSVLSESETLRKAAE